MIEIHTCLKGEQSTQHIGVEDTRHVIKGSVHDFLAIAADTRVSHQHIDRCHSTLADGGRQLGEG